MPGEVKLWDLAAGKEKKALEGHTATVFAVAFSPDGKALVSGAWDNTARVWDPATGKELKVLEGHTDAVRSRRLQPRRQDAGDGGLRRAGQAVGRGDVEGNRHVRGPRRRRQRRRLLTGRQDPGHLQAARRAARPRRGHASGTPRLGPSGTCCTTSAARCWRSASRRTARRWRRPAARRRTSARSSCGTRSPAGERTCAARAPAVGRGAGLLEGRQRPGHRAAASCGRAGEVHLWDVAPTPAEVVLTGHAAAVTCGAFAADGKTLATGSSRQDRPALGPGRAPRAPDAEGPHGRQSRRWRSLRRRQDRLQRRRGPDGPGLGRDDRQGGRRRSPASASPWSGLALSPDGKALAAACGGDAKGDGPGEVRVYDLAAGKQRAILAGHPRAGRGRGLRAGRQAARFGERRRHDEGVGRGHAGQSGKPGHVGRRRAPWRSRPTAGRWPRGCGWTNRATGAGGPTSSCACWTRRAGTSGRSASGRRGRRWACPSPRTAGAWRRPAATAPRRCGQPAGGIRKLSRLAADRRPARTCDPPPNSRRSVMIRYCFLAAAACAAAGGGAGAGGRRLPRCPRCADKIDKFVAQRWASEKAHAGAGGRRRRVPPPRLPRPGRPHPLASARSATSWTTPARTSGPAPSSGCSTGPPTSTISPTSGRRCSFPRTTPTTSSRVIYMPSFEAWLRKQFAGQRRPTTRWCASC